MRKRRRAKGYAVSGDWNVIDDVTGFKEKASDLQVTWKGMYTKSWDPKHPSIEFTISGDDQKASEPIRTFSVTFDAITTTGIPS